MKHGIKKAEVRDYLQSKHGECFASEAICNRESSIGDEWVAFGSVDIVREIYAYMKQLAASLSSYTTKVEWRDMLNFSDFQSFPIFDLYDAASKLSYEVSNTAQELACRFISKAAAFFRYLRELFSFSDREDIVSQSDQENVLRLENEIKNCSTYVNQLGNKAVEFIQWIARRIRGALSFVLDVAMTVYEFAARSIGDVARLISHEDKNLSYYAKQALRVGIFSVAATSEMSKWTVLRAEEVRKRGAQLGEVVVRRLSEVIGRYISSFDNKLETLSRGFIAFVAGGSQTAQMFFNRLPGYGAIASAYGSVADFVKLIFQKIVHFITQTVEKSEAALNSILSVITRYVIEPVTEFISPYISNLWKDRGAVDMREDLEVAEYYREKFPNYTPLNDAIARAKEYEKNAKETVARARDDISIGERMDLSWTLSGGVISIIEGKEATQGQIRAADRILGSAFEIQDEGEQARVQLKLAINCASIYAADDLKDRSSVYDLEDDEEFARLWGGTVSINSMLVEGIYDDAETIVAPLVRAKDEAVEAADLRYKNYIDREWSEQIEVFRGGIIKRADQRIPFPKEEEISLVLRKIKNQIEDDIALREREILSSRWFTAFLIALGLAILVSAVYSWQADARRQEEEIFAQESTWNVFARQTGEFPVLASITGGNLDRASISNESYVSGLIDSVDSMSARDLSFFYQVNADYFDSSSVKDIIVLNGNTRALIGATSPVEIENPSGPLSWFTGNMFSGNTQQSVIIAQDDLSRGTQESMRLLIKTSLRYQIDLYHSSYRTWIERVTGESTVSWAFNKVLDLYFPKPPDFSSIETVTVAAGFGLLTAVKQHIRTAQVYFMLCFFSIGLLLNVMHYLADTLANIPPEYITVRSRSNLKSTLQIMGALNGTFDVLLSTLSDITEEMQDEWTKSFAAITNFTSGIVFALSIFNPATWLGIFYAGLRISSGMASYAYNKLFKKPTPSLQEEQLKVLEASGPEKYTPLRLTGRPN